MNSPLLFKTLQLIGYRFNIAIFLLFSHVVYSDISINGTSINERQGSLPDGTPYLIHVPANWNKILLRDLDYADGASGPNSDRYNLLLKHVYAIAGTARHKLRQWRYDPVHEIDNLNQLLDMFVATYGNADKVIQYGCSGGGQVSLAVAETYPDRIDGAVALAAHTPVWLMNSFLDGWFALKALISNHYLNNHNGEFSDNLVITGLPNPVSMENGQDLIQSNINNWKNAVQLTGKSPDGRARLALAFALGQWSPWLDTTDTAPDLDNPEALANTIYNSAMVLTASPGGQARLMFENAAYGQQLSWNNDTDYKVLFDNANPSLKAAVEILYKKSNLDLQADLELINNQARINSDQFALDHWAKPGRTVTGSPKIPVIRLHMVGDYAVPYSLVQGYNQLIKDNGKDDLYRYAYVKSTGHCNFSPTESLAAVEVLIERINHGKWRNTDYISLNSLASSFNESSLSRFIPLNGWSLPVYNRIWVPVK